MQWHAAAIAVLGLLEHHMPALEVDVAPVELQCLAHPAQPVNKRNVTGRAMCGAQAAMSRSASSKVSARRRPHGCLRRSKTSGGQSLRLAAWLRTALNGANAGRLTVEGLRLE